MMRLRSDLLEHIEHAIDGHLDRSRALWDARPALGVVMAADGYPGKPSTGNMTNTWDVPDVDDTKVFHAGTEWKSGVEGKMVVVRVDTGGRRSIKKKTHNIPN